MQQFKHYIKSQMPKCVIALLAIQLVACASHVKNPNQKDLTTLNAKNASTVSSSATGLNANGVSVQKINEDDSKPVIKSIDLKEIEKKPMGDVPQPKVIYFDVDSNILSADAQKVSEKHASYMVNNQANDTPRQLILQGHTDERGTSEYNLALGQRRAEAVKRAMLLLGVNGKNIEAVSFGEEKPAAEGDTEASFKQNRRVEWAY